MTKLEQLAKIEGQTVLELLQTATFDSVAACICTNKDCDYTEYFEPDCQNAFCEFCETQTVTSCLILAGLC